MDSLIRLEEEDSGNLISNPITKLEKTQEISEKHFVCFPSAVIELKHHKATQAQRDKCYFQAANATPTALAMLDRLSLCSILKESFGEIRPVVAFTFISFESRFWMTFIRGRVWENNQDRLIYVSLFY
jgi:hypothetical protein